MMRSSRTPAYDAFEQTVLTGIVDFAQHLDPARMNAAVAAVAALPPQIVAVDENTRVVTILNGWCSTSSAMSLSRRHLERANPGYSVSVTRMPRRELGIRGRLLRPGFRVEAIGSARLPPFALSFHNGQYSLPGSNSDVRFQLERHISPRKEVAEGAGYLDSMLAFPAPSDEAPEGWLATIANAHPHELQEFVFSVGGRAFAKTVSDALLLFPINARWSDKLAVSAHGADFTPTSDLELVTILRPNPTDPTPTHGILQPEMHQVGSVVVAGEGARMLPSPSTEWLSITDAVVQDGGTVTSGGSLIVYEDSSDPVHDFVSGQWTTVFGSPVRPEAALIERKACAPSEVAEGILLAGRSDFNWFHWMVEYLPRALMAEGVVADGIPVLVTSRVPATGMQALAALSDRPVVVLDPDVSTRVGTLHVVAPPSQLLDTTRVPWAEGLSMNPAPLRAVRAALCVGATSEPTRLIFLERRSAHRGVVNEHALAKIAAGQGLEVIDPSDLSFHDQVNLFSSSRLIVGASGAVMANFMFMREGSSILALTSDLLSDFILPAAIASVVGAHFSYVTGPATLTGCENRDEMLHADFHIDPRIFQAGLEAELRRIRAAG